MKKAKKTPLLEGERSEKMVSCEKLCVFPGKSIYQGSRRRQLYLECRGNAGSSRESLVVVNLLW